MKECSLLAPSSSMARLNSTLFPTSSRKRRGGDSNPRDPCGPTGFRDQHIQPLCHLSGGLPPETNPVRSHSQTAPEYFTPTHETQSAHHYALPIRRLIMTNFLLRCLLIIAFFGSFSLAADTDNLNLWYRQPAGEWTDAGRKELSADHSAALIRTGPFWR
jgi:hypothetical protein